MTLLSPHFSLEELTRSATATAHGIDNTPTEEARAQLVRLCRDVLEPIRAKYGAPMPVKSGYRCPQLNAKIGGASKTSQHMKGEAVDINVGMDNRKLFHIIAEMMDKGEIRVGQLIWEKGDQKNPAWVHISLPRPGKPNNVILYLGVKK